MSLAGSTASSTSTILYTGIWPLWSRLPRNGKPLLGEGSVAAPPEAERPVPSPSAAPVPPSLAHPEFKVQCIPLQERAWLEEQLRFECDAQSAAGLRLTSTFTHDGDLFLVFKRAEWITLADVSASARQENEAAGAERRAGGF